MNLRLLLPRPVRRLPADLAAIICLTLLTDLFALAPVLNETPVRIVLGLVFVLFAPGYAFITALFPESGGQQFEPGLSSRSEFDPDDGIDGIERLALSLGTSIAIVPLIGLLLNFTPFGIRLVPIVCSLSLFTIGMSIVAAVRRWRIPADERFSVPYSQAYQSTKSELLNPDSRTDGIVNVVLVLSLVLAISSVGYAVIAPNDGEQFTELYLLTENESGELVADGYPENVSAGEPQSLVLGIGNHEEVAVNYTVVVELQRVSITNESTGQGVVNASDNSSNISVEVLESRELNRFSPRVGSNQTWLEPHTVSPSLQGEDVRLVYLLYKGEPPNNPSTENAYREVHLWLNVSDTTPQRGVEDA